MKASFDTVVVGGGIVGIAAARLLALDERSCVVLEKDSVGSHASGFAYGGLHPMAGAGIPGPVTLLAERGFELHERLAEELPKATGIDIEYRRNATISLSFSEDDALANSGRLETVAARSHLDWMRQRGADVEWLDRDGVLAAEPRVSPEAIGGVLNRDTAEVEPYRFLLALTQDAERAGVEIRNRQATGIMRSGSKVTGVALDDGDVLACGSVLLAAGPWTEQLAAASGATVGIRPLKGQILRLEAPGHPYEHSIGWAGNYVTSKPDGLMWAGTTEEEAGFDERPTAAGRDTIMAGLIKMVPALQDARLVKQTACLRPMSADGLPVIGALPGWEGVTVATGAGRKGILLGPAMAEIAADIVMDRAATIDNSAFSPSRFQPSP